MKEHILAKILRYFIYAAALVPLIIFSQYVSPFHFGKVVIFRSLIEIMMVLYLFLVWLDRSYRPHVDKIFWAFLAFVAVFSLTTLTSINIYQSFWGTLERMGGLWSFWHYFVYYIILISVIRKKQDWIKFLKLMVGVGVLSAFYGFGQRTNMEFFIGSGGRSRIFGTIGNPALFAGYQIINVFIALILGLASQNKRERNLLFAATVTMTLAVFMTAVRGSILGISVGFLLFAFLYFAEFHSKRAKQVLLGLVMFGVLFFLSSLLLKNTSLIKNSPYLSRVTNFSLSSYTVQTRFWAWQAGLKGWSDTPKTMLVGWGPENFNVPFSKYFNPKFYSGPGAETLFDRAHNMFVEVLVTMGILGLLTYVSIFVAMFMTLWRLRRDPEKRLYAIGLISLMFAYIIHNAFIFDTSANFIAFFSVLGFASFLGRVQQKPELSSVRKTSGLWVVAAVVLFIAVTILIYKTNVLQSKANYATTRGIVAGWQNDFNGAMDAYKKAISYNVPGKYEERNRFAQYLLDYSPTNKIDTPNVQDAFKLAISEVEKNAAENKFDYLPELYLSRLNIILGKDDPKSSYNDEALRHALKALSYSPTFVRTYYEIAQAYLNKKDFPHAIEFFRKAMELNPKVGVSYWYLAAVQIESGDINGGLATYNQAFSKGFRPTEQDYLRLANIYLKRNDFQNIAKIYEGLVYLVPNNAQYHASLAVAYVRIGRIDDAVTQAHLAVKLDLGFENDAKAFVQSLGRQW